VKSQSKNISGEKVTIFTLFRMNFHFKGVKSHLKKKSEIHSFEVKIHSKKDENCHSFSRREIFSLFFQG